MLLFVGLALASAAYWTIVPPAQRRRFLIASSILLLYALQPASGVGSLNIVLPTVTLIMVVGVWMLIAEPDTTQSRRPGAVPAALIGFGIAVILTAPEQATLINLLRDTILNGLQNHVDVLLTFGTLAGISVLALPKYKGRFGGYLVLAASVLALLFLARRGQIPAQSILNSLADALTGLPSSGPGTLLIVLAGLSAFPIIVPRSSTVNRRHIALAWLGVMLVLLFLIKVPGLALTATTQPGKATTVQDSAAANFGWLGISYIIFRLAHVLIDYRENTLKARPGLTDFVIYVLFFPSIVAGPITRVEQIAPQLQTNLATFKPDYLVVGGLRILVGIFKKFVIADQIAVITAQPNLLGNLTNTPALWLILYASLFHLYFDFSGYSDMAVGLGQLFGISLPENFDRPFAQPNLSLFWQSWHITLSAWFRYYWFNPLTRRLMRTSMRRHQNVIVLSAQVSTMALVGLWHGVTLNWLAWGVWHGLGLFAHKVLGDSNRQRYQQWASNPTSARLLHVTNVLLTTHFMLLSMVFLVVPDFGQSLRYLLALFGVKP